MQPLQFDPILKRTAWGGRRLGTVLGKPIGDRDDYGESWEIADCGDQQTTVRDGSYRGWTLSRLVAEHAGALLGSDRDRRPFPLLIKFLDARRRLSVQVHPNDEQARRMNLGQAGKTESWVILDAQPGSLIFAGLRADIDRAMLVRHLEAGTIESCLHQYPARPGDCVYVPAGTVHAIGEGILLAEIQQSSDVTFRLDDWGRVGPDGTPRMLHRDQALACVDFERGPVDPVRPRQVFDVDGPVEDLVRCPHFAVSRYTLTKRRSLPTDGRFLILIVVAGVVDVESPDDQRRLDVGSTLLIPAALDAVVLSSIGSDATVLVTRLP